MKKILFLLLALTTSITYCFSQGVAIDKTEEDGSRVIGTYYSFVRYVGHISLAYFNIPSECEKWQLSLTLGWMGEKPDQMSIGRKLLIKTDSGKVIELENNEEIGPIDYEFEGLSTAGFEEYSITPSYWLSEEQIKELCSSNVVKIRVETNSGTLDKEVKPKSFRKVINSEYEAICAAKSKGTGVYDNF